MPKTPKKGPWMPPHDPEGPLYKTQMCGHTNCPDPEKCNYAHSKSELRAPRDGWRKELAARPSNARAAVEARARAGADGAKISGGRVVEYPTKKPDRVYLDGLPTGTPRGLSTWWGPPADAKPKPAAAGSVPDPAKVAAGGPAMPAPAPAPNTPTSPAVPPPGTDKAAPKAAGAALPPTAPDEAASAALPATAADEAAPAALSATAADEAAPAGVSSVSARPADAAVGGTERATEDDMAGTVRSLTAKLVEKCLELGVTPAQFEAAHTAREEARAAAEKAARDEAEKAEIAAAMKSHVDALDVLSRRLREVGGPVAS